MGLKPIQKELLKAIVKYGKSSTTLAEVINKSRIFENRGIAIVNTNDSLSHLFLKQDVYEGFEDNTPYIILSDIEMILGKLEKDGVISFNYNDDCLTTVIGTENSRYVSPTTIAVSNGQFITEYGNSLYWVDSNNTQTYWKDRTLDEDLDILKFLNSKFNASPEIKSLVINKFKDKEEVRFEKQIRMQWISIVVAIALGILGIIF